MALSKISITRVKGVLKLTPVTLKAQPADQIFWVNNDSQPQQPVVINPNGTHVPIVAAIAPGTTSNVYAPFKAPSSYTVSYTLASAPQTAGKIQVS